MNILRRLIFRSLEVENAVFCLQTFDRACLDGESLKSYLAQPVGCAQVSQPILAGVLGGRLRGPLLGVHR
jgi:hypothetical protein